MESSVTDYPEKLRETKGKGGSYKTSAQLSSWGFLL